jgi:TP901 family phage tail tape measure protein
MGTRRLLVRIVTEYVDKGIKESKKDVESLSDAIGDKLSNVAAGAVVAAGAAMTAAVVKFVRDSMAEFQQFDKGMREVFTLMPGMSQEAMGVMEQQALDAATEMGKLPEEVVPALYQALSAGVPSDNVFEFLETANAAAMGGVTDLETAVDGITSVVNAYGDEIIDATTASDVMFTAVRLGKTNFEQLSNSLFNVVPTAASLGVTFTDVAANLAALTAQGVPTSVATTQLRQAFVEASKSGSDLDLAIQALTGKTFAQLIASGMTSSEIFTTLRDSMPEQEFRDLFGSVEASNAVLGITNDTAADIIESFGGVEDTLNATADAAETMAGSIEHLDKVNQASWSAAKIAIGDTLGPLRSAYLESSTFVAQNVTVQKRLSDAYKENTIAYSDWLKLSRLANSGAEGQAEAMAILARASGEVGMAVKDAGDNISNFETQNRAAAAAARDAATAAEDQRDRLRDVNRTLLEFNQANGITKPLAAATTRELEEMAYATGDLGEYEQAMLAPIRANNEALEEQEEAAKLAAEAHRELESRMGSYFTAALEGAESTETVEEMLYREAQAAGAPAEALAILAAMTGNFTDEQIEAALKTAAMTEKAREMGQAIADGSISIQQARIEMVTFQAELENPLEPQFNTDSINTGIEQTAALISEIKNIPLNVATSIVMNGLDDSKRGIGELITLINQVDGRSASASVTVNTSAPGDLGSGSSGGGKPSGKALGGPVNEGQPYIIGERGPELFVPNTSGTVVPNGGYGGYSDYSQTIYQITDDKSAALVAALTDSRKRSRLDDYMGAR